MPRSHRLIEVGTTVPKFPFLSDEWFIEVRRIVDDLAAEVPPHAQVRMNLVVTGTPFGSDRLLHVDTSDGGTDWGSGLLDDADLTLTTDYVTARDIFVSANPQAGMQAFMDGRVKLQGDLTKLMAAQLA